MALPAQISQPPPSAGKPPVGRTTPPDLDDRRLFVKVPNVPVFAEHCRPKRKLGDDGKYTLTDECVDKKHLSVICNNSQKRAEMGEYSPIFLGHTSDDAPETAQPPIIGWSKNHRIGTHPRTDEPVIIQDWYVKRNQLHLLEEYPYRSAEIRRKMTPRGFIFATAITRRAPELDLGLLTRHNLHDPIDQIESHPCRCQDKSKCSCEQHTENFNNQSDAGKPMLTPEDIAAMADALKPMIKDAIHEYIMESSEETPADQDINDDGIPDADELPPGAPPATAQYTASPPSGTNTAMPTIAAHGTERYNAQDRERIGNDETRLLIRRLEGRIKQLETTNTQLIESNNAMADRYNMTSREQVLTQLQGEGYELDRAQELEDCADLTPERFNMHVDRIRRSYKQSPIGADFIHTADNGGRTVTQRPDADDPDDIAHVDPEEVVRYCHKEGIKDAKTAVKSFLDARREQRKAKRA